MTTRDMLEQWRARTPRLLVIAGLRKAGKTVAISYILKNFQPLSHIRIADAPFRIAEILKIQPSREVYHALFYINELLRPVLGEAAFKRRAAKILDEERPPLALVDAIRTWEEYDEFVRKRGGILIGIHADDAARHRRATGEAAIGEKEDERSMSLEEFLAKEQHPIEREIKAIVARSHILIENNHEDAPPFFDAIDLELGRLGLKKTA